MSNSQPTANDLLNGGGGPPSFKFDKVGDTAKGVITGLGVSQVSDFKTKELRFYSDGNPIMQIVITLLQDDGEETRIFVKPQAKVAIREAVIAAGATELEVNGKLALVFSDTEPPAQAGLSPKKVFTAQYKAPAAAIPTDELI